MNELQSIQATTELINAGQPLMLAGSEAALAALPSGNWIGGTIPYFMTPNGGVFDEGRIYVSQLPKEAIGAVAKLYDVASIHDVAVDAPENGFTYLVLPAFSEMHEHYSKEAPTFTDMFVKPIVGWISGGALSTLSDTKPKVFFGPTKESFDNRAVALQVELDKSVRAEIDIVNLFKPGQGPTIQFSQNAFGAEECLIDGTNQNLAKYIADHGIDTKLPLVADFCGAIINTSLQAVNADEGTVRFYAPVFEGVEYRFAEPIGEYSSEFQKQIPEFENTIFSCNCILNYLYGELEGKSLGTISGPITFGEVAYQLVNQTMVYLELKAA